MRLFQYCIIYNPLPTKEQKEQSETPKSILVRDVTSILCQSDREAMMLIAREIPDQYSDKLERVEIAIRPF